MGPHPKEAGELLGATVHNKRLLFFSPCGQGQKCRRSIEHHVSHE